MTAREIKATEGRVGTPRRRRGPLIVAAALALAAVIVGHRLVPNVRGLGSLLDTVTPFLGLGIPVLVLVALLRRSWIALAAVAVPALAWVLVVGLTWLPNGGGGAVQLRVASQNLMADNPDPVATVTAVAGTGADILALEEISDRNQGLVADSLRDRYPHRATVSTVGLWSRFPIREYAGVDTGLAWPRALRAVVAAPGGDLVVYVVHLGSARAGATELRDRTVAMLADRLRQEPAGQVIVVGDFNTATTDRVIAPLTDQLADAQADAGVGPGFTWPAGLPLTRPDQVLYRGLTAASAGVVRTPASDHRAVTAGFRR